MLQVPRNVKKVRVTAAGRGKGMLQVRNVTAGRSQPAVICVEPWLCVWLIRYVLLAGFQEACQRFIREDLTIHQAYEFMKNVPGKFFS